MFLIVNTADNQEFHLAFLDTAGECMDSVSKSAPFQQEEFVLQTLTDLLNKNNKQIKDLAGLAVVDGPGSFSSLRIGITIANTLAWTLNIPVVSIAFQDFTEPEQLYKLAFVKLADNSGQTGHYINPEYGREPNIT